MKRIASFLIFISVFTGWFFLLSMFTINEQYRLMNNLEHRLMVQENFSYLLVSQNRALYWGAMANFRELYNRTINLEETVPSIKQETFKQVALSQKDIQRAIYRTGKRIWHCQWKIHEIATELFELNGGRSFLDIPTPRANPCMRDEDEKLSKVPGELLGIIDYDDIQFSQEELGELFDLEDY